MPLNYHITTILRNCYDIGFALYNMLIRDVWKWLNFTLLKIYDFTTLKAQKGLFLFSYADRSRGADLPFIAFRPRFSWYISAA